MQVNYTTADGRMTVTVNADDFRGLFKQIADFQEVFEQRNININGELVDSKDVRFQVRKNAEDDEFYEMVYAGTVPALRGYKLEFGCHKKGGGLFPKKKDKEGNWVENNGWTKWQGNKETASEAPAKTGSKSGKAPF